MAYSTFNSIIIDGIATAIPSNKISMVELKEETTSRSQFIYKSSKNQTTSDLGFLAAKRIIDNKRIPLHEIGVIIFVSKTPDYRGPATAAVLQGRLNLSKDCIAYDVNIGSSGFIYGSQIVCSHLDSTNKEYGLLIVGDTATKQVLEEDNLKMLFSDGASAIMFKKENQSNPIYINTKSYGEKYKFYSINKGGFRQKKSQITKKIDKSIKDNYIKINSIEYNKFINKEIPKSIHDFILQFDLKDKEYDALAFHQFKPDTIHNLPKELNFSNKNILNIFNLYGNTCGNSIPLMLTHEYGKKTSRKIKIFACAFGEGFSLGLIDVEINTENIFDIILTKEYYKEGFIFHNE